MGDSFYEYLLKYWLLTGKKHDMYKRMYETQADWGEGQDSQAALFRGFAEDLDLDPQAFGDPVARDQAERHGGAGEMGIAA